jgi:hypothetical protein
VSLEFAILCIIVFAVIAADTVWEFIGWIIAITLALCLWIAPQYIPDPPDDCIQTVGLDYDGRLGAWVAPDGHVVYVAATEDSFKECDIT